MPACRVALISDVHGHAYALRRVLEDIDQRGVDRIACLGDVATLGPHPHEVLELVCERCDLVILGNHDEYLLDDSRLGDHSHSPLIVAAVAQCRGQLDAAELAFVRSFSRSALAPLCKGSQLLLFHGSPNSNNCDLLAETPEDELAKHLGAHREAVMAGGHTHISLLRQDRGRWLVNPGSVGLPFERFVNGAPPTVLAHAEYAIVESRPDGTSVTLHRVNLERSRLLDSLHGWDSPLAEYLTQQYVAI